MYGAWSIFFSLRAADIAGCIVSPLRKVVERMFFASVTSGRHNFGQNSTPTAELQAARKVCFGGF
jgi:hypothetical protein